MALSVQTNQFQLICNHHIKSQSLYTTCCYSWIDFLQQFRFWSDPWRHEKCGTTLSSVDIKHLGSRMKQTLQNPDNGFSHFDVLSDQSVSPPPSLFYCDGCLFALEHAEQHWYILLELLSFSVTMIISPSYDIKRHQVTISPPSSCWAIMTTACVRVPTPDAITFSQKGTFLMSQSKQFSHLQIFCVPLVCVPFFCRNFSIHMTREYFLVNLWKSCSLAKI